MAGLPGQRHASLGRVHAPHFRQLCAAVRWPPSGDGQHTASPGSFRPASLEPASGQPLPAPSTAQPPAQPVVADVVQLKDGGYLRGLILEIEPQSHLVLQLPGGEQRRIPIEQVESAERDGKPLNWTGGRTAEPSAEVGTTPRGEPLVPTLVASERPDG